MEQLNEYTQYIYGKSFVILLNSRDILQCLAGGKSKAKSLLVLLLFNINKSVLTVKKKNHLGRMGSVELSDWHRGLHKSFLKKSLATLVSC